MGSNANRSELQKMTSRYQALINANKDLKTLYKKRYQVSRCNIPYDGTAITFAQQSLKARGLEPKLIDEIFAEIEYAVAQLITIPDSIHLPNPTGEISMTTSADFVDMSQAGGFDHSDVQQMFKMFLWINLGKAQEVLLDPENVAEPFPLTSVDYYTQEIHNMNGGKITIIWAEILAHQMAILELESSQGESDE